MSIESNTYDSRAPEERNVYGKAALERKFNYVTTNF